MPQFKKCQFEWIRLYWLLGLVICFTFHTVAVHITIRRLNLLNNKTCSFKFIQFVQYFCILYDACIFLFFSICLLCSVDLYLLNNNGYQGLYLFSSCFVVCQIRPTMWWTTWKTTEIYLKCTLKARVDITSHHDVPYSVDLATVSKCCFIWCSIWQQPLKLFLLNQNTIQPHSWGLWF